MNPQKKELGELVAELRSKVSAQGTAKPSGGGATIGPVKLKDDPAFAKYFKMEKMGVPRPAVAMKFAQETGMDPSLLDTPDAPAPPGGEPEEDEGSDEDSD